MSVHRRVLRRQGKLHPGTVAPLLQNGESMAEILAEKLEASQNKPRPRLTPPQRPHNPEFSGTKNWGDSVSVLVLLSALPSIVFRGKRLRVVSRGTLSCAIWLPR